jgi:hypothetical protein
MIVSRLPTPLILTVLISLTFAANARANCTKDIECKGNRICEKGICQSPAVDTSNQATKRANRQRKKPTKTSKGRLSAGLGLSLMHIDGMAREWKFAPGGALYYEKGSWVGVVEIYVNGQPLTGLSAGGGLNIRFGKMVSIGFLALGGVWEGRHWVTDRYTSYPEIDDFPVVQTAFVWLQPFIRLGGKLSLVIRPRLGIVGVVEERRNYPNGTSRASAAAGLTTDIVYRF